MASAAAPLTMHATIGPGGSPARGGKYEMCIRDRIMGVSRGSVMEKNRRTGPALSLIHIFLSYSEVAANRYGIAGEESTVKRSVCIVVLQAKRRMDFCV